MLPKRRPLQQRSRFLKTGRYQFSEAKSSPGWLEVPRGQEDSETKGYGNSQSVNRSDRPFLSGTEISASQIGAAVFRLKTGLGRI